MLLMRWIMMRRSRMLVSLIGASVYPDFNTVVNRAITTAGNKQDETRDRKRKFEAKREYPQEKTMKL
jgi:hypothetical protein